MIAHRSIRLRWPEQFLVCLPDGIGERNGVRREHLDVLRPHGIGLAEAAH